jgi:RHS repeat-associated protein
LEFGFQGQFRDGETGWYNYGYRFYVPLLGRWINRDPIGEDGDKNIYGFVDENAIDEIDSLGLSPKDDCENQGKYWILRFPDPGFEINGCSAPLGPAKDNPFGLGCSFLEACNTHHQCYQECDKSRSECDRGFLRDMDRICRSCSSKFIFPVNLKIYVDCRVVAETYYLAVAAFGGRYYEDGQNRRCECKDCY